MEEKIVLNNRLKTWLFDIVEDMIESTIEDSPNKVATIIAVNNFVEQFRFRFTRIRDDWNNWGKDNK